MSNQMEEIKAFNERRNALFRNPTMETALAYWIERGFPPPVTITVPLATVHKARLQWLDVTDAMIEESKLWLIANGYRTTDRGIPPLTPERRDEQRAMYGKPPLAGVK